MDSCERTNEVVGDRLLMDSSPSICVITHEEDKAGNREYFKAKLVQFLKVNIREGLSCKIAS